MFSRISFGRNTSSSYLFYAFPKAPVTPTMSMWCSRPLSQSRVKMSIGNQCCVSSGNLSLTLATGRVLGIFRWLSIVALPLLIPERTSLYHLYAYSLCMRVNWMTRLPSSITYLIYPHSPATRRWSLYPSTFLVW